LAPAAGLKVTLFAPPHWVFWMTEPPALHGCTSEQVEPSGMPYSQWMWVSSLEVTCILSIDMASSPLEVMYGWSLRLAVMHFSWKMLWVELSRLWSELEQWNPENWLLPKWSKGPVCRPPQL